MAYDRRVVIGILVQSFNTLGSRFIQLDTMLGFVKMHEGSRSAKFVINFILIDL